MQSSNPYQPPESKLELAEAPITELELVLASTQDRFLTYLIDMVLFVGYAMVVGIVLGVLLAILQVDFDSVAKHFDLLLGLMIFLSYYLLFEYCWGRTPGKWIIGTKVVNREGKAPSFLQIVGRSLARNIPFEPLSFLFGRPPKGWHDTLSGTRVVSLKKLADLRAGNREKLLSDANPAEPEKPANWAQMSEAAKALWEMRQQQAAREAEKKSPG